MRKTAKWGVTGVVAVGVLRFGAFPPEACPPLADADVAGAQDAAATWLIANQHADGRYLYTYQVGVGELDVLYNDVRHAGTTMQLFAHDTPEALEAGDAAYAWMRALFEERHGWVAPRDGDDASLGTAALLTSALLNRRDVTGSSEHDETLRALGRFMLALQRDDGSFSTRWVFPTDVRDEVETSAYYPGEATWALARLGTTFPDEPEWAASARLGLHDLATARDDRESVRFPPLNDHWAAYALAELAPGGLPDEEVDYARSLASRFGMLVRSEQARATGPLGVAVRGPWVRAGGFATWMEGLDQLATIAQIADMHGGIVDRVRCGAGVLVDRQIRNADAPQETFGAWLTGPAGEVRMDDVQHAMGALKNLPEPRDA